MRKFYVALSYLLYDAPMRLKKNASRTGRTVACLCLVCALVSRLVLQFKGGASQDLCSKTHRWKPVTTLQKMQRSRLRLSLFVENDGHYRQPLWHKNKNMKLKQSLNYRFPVQNRVAYASYNEDVAQGSFVIEPVIALLSLLTRAQHKLGIQGALGEIGVHHGKFFVGLAHLALEHEKLYACDVFGEQKLNLDGSGFGDFDAFKSACTKGGITPDAVTVEKRSSSSLPSLPYKFRLFSIDGGHTRELTVNDLTLVACHLQSGGIIILDDITNFEWPGVIDGFFTWMNYFPVEFAAFFVGYNKVFITHSEYHNTYYSVLLHYSHQAPEGMKLMTSPSSNKNPHKSKDSGSNQFSWLGAPFVYGDNSVNLTIAREEWLKFIS